MMKHSALDDIRTLRGEETLQIDMQNKNRYRVLIKESFGTTAYCFSTPIYELQSRKLVTLRFVTTEAGFVHHGSNGRITVRENCVTLHNDNGTVVLTFPGSKFIDQGTCLRNETVTLRPTLNGIAVAVHTEQKTAATLWLHTQNPYLHIRANEKYVALMQEEFRPFVSVSALYAKQKDGAGCYPIQIGYTQTQSIPLRYTLRFAAEQGTELHFEVNLYEPKLFQDTTVESKHPDENNAFGSMAFLGRTEAFGEQWLYTRLDLSKLPECYDLPVKKVLLHLPRYHTANAADLAVYVPQARFCSFGANWNNKITHANAVTASRVCQAYHTVDITDLLLLKPEGLLQYTEGIILKYGGRDGGFSAVATGDNYDTPQILEIQY